jgi:hypothetical protein
LQLSLLLIFLRQNGTRFGLTLDKVRKDRWRTKKLKIRPRLTPTAPSI